MKECVIAYLAQKGYKVNKTALEVIKLCDDWYSSRNIEDFHVRENLNNVKITLEKTNMAKRCCADDANLCEIISVRPEEDEKNLEFIEDFLQNNSFDVQYREQLERMTACGTEGAYIYLQNADYMRNHDGTVRISGGTVKINYVDADCILPLTVENKTVTECAFSATEVKKGREITTLVIFTIENGRYIAETVVFNDMGKEIEAEHSEIQLGEVKPFAIMRVAEVNNIDNMIGYGLPKIYHNIPILKAVDLCFSLLFGDLDKGQKMVFINELLATVDTQTGKPILSRKQQEVFIMLGEKLPDQDSVIKEYNPEIRVEEITKTFELVLSLLSMKFGYGTKKYKFENGQIQTATEYIGEKQDELQELNKQRKQSIEYIEDIIKAAMWFSNEFSKTNLNLEDGIVIDFDDSLIEDKGSKLEAMRTDALSFVEVPEFTIRYIMEKLGVTRDEAKEMMDGTYEPEEVDD